jgi:hypothetical protein
MLVGELSQFFGEAQGRLVLHVSAHHDASVAKANHNHIS